MDVPLPGIEPGLQGLRNPAPILAGAQAFLSLIPLFFSNKKFQNFRNSKDPNLLNNKLNVDYLFPLSCGVATGYYITPFRAFQTASKANRS